MRALPLFRAIVEMARVLDAINSEKETKKYMEKYADDPLRQDGCERE